MDILLTHGDSLITDVKTKTNTTKTSRKTQMRIRVLGGAREVGGSCISLETDQCKIALDYGIKLEGTTDQYPKNFNAIIISHAHLDHSGSLPRLTNSRNSQLVVSPKVTRDITADMLVDMIKIQKEGGNDEFDDQVVAKIKEVWWKSCESIAFPGMNVKLLPAGHVAGARVTSIITEGKQLVYTGDFCLHNSEILDGCNLNVISKEPEVLIMESTYGGTVRPPRETLVNEFFGVLQKQMRRRANILIPTFAFHRSQEMAKRLDEALDKHAISDYNVYVISSLARKITAHFNVNKDLFADYVREQNQPFTYKHVKQIERTEEIIEPAIVICTSGFGHAGASLSLLAEWAGGEDNAVILTSGYLPDDSPLRLAREKGFFRKDGEKIPVYAQFENVELSGHADQSELVETVRVLKPRKTLLVHGDLKQAERLSEKISELTEVCVPEKNEAILV